MHIKSFGFRGLRKLNLNHDYNNPNFDIRTIKQFEASKINILVGPNGGGKSTVVDLVRAMGDANALRTIARENMINVTSSGFVVYFDNGNNVLAQFQISEDGFELILLSGSGDSFSGSLHKDKSASVPKKLGDVINSLQANVVYRNRHDEHDEDKVAIPTQKFIDALNADAKHLSGLAPFPLTKDQDAYLLPPSFCLSHRSLHPVRLIKDGILSISFNDDQRQNNNVPIEMLPSGWRAFGGLVAWLSEQIDGSICVIEEPETHIHAKLLRILMLRISELVKSKKLQIFMTTHSSTLIDINTWPDSNVALFEADGYQVRELTSPSLALANLGLRPSDVCQANGVIWVEGSSDRIYLIHWLKLWCEKHSQTLPIENIAFSFVFYGGSMLKHFTGKTSNGLIEIFKINQNSIVVMDRDLDFVADTKGHEIAKNELNAKAIIYKDINLSARTGRYCWITQKYTIESYLPSEFRVQYFVFEKERLKTKKNVTKMNVAEQFRRKYSDFDLSHETGSDLPEWIEKLYFAIKLWNA